MRREDGNYTGNDQYIGYCVDLLKKISKMVGFNYSIKIVDDGFHGALVDGKWNGIVSELIDKVKHIFIHVYLIFSLIL
jgi:hypothetical protein